MNKKILISTGGSGGHVIPATIIYKHLEGNFDVSMTSDFRGVKFLNKDEYNLKIFNVKNSVNSKKSYGGTAFDNIKKMIMKYKKQK